MINGYEHIPFDCTIQLCYLRLYNKGQWQLHKIINNWNFVTLHYFDNVDPLLEQRSSSVYVPRDEAFSEVKQLTFSAKTLKSVMHALLPQLEISLLDPHLGFPHFTAIDLLFCEGLTLPKPTNAGFFQSILPRLVKAVTDTQENLLPFETPAFIDSMHLILFVWLSLSLSLSLSGSHLYTWIFFCRR